MTRQDMFANTICSRVAYFSTLSGLLTEPALCRASKIFFFRLRLLQTYLGFRSQQTRHKVTGVGKHRAQRQQFHPSRIFVNHTRP